MNVVPWYLNYYYLVRFVNSLDFLGMKRMTTKMKRMTKRMTKRMMIVVVALDNKISFSQVVGKESYLYNALSQLVYLLLVFSNEQDAVAQLLTWVVLKGREEAEVYV